MPPLPNDIITEFAQYSGCFLIKDLKSKQVQVFNEKQCQQEWTPLSTYKILNSLIGLETGVLKDANTIINWNGEKQPFKTWEKNHSLESAMKGSVVPYYQEVAKRVGKERMQAYINQANYGNKIIGEQIDRFWLDGPLKITAYQQLEFVEKLYTGHLPFSKTNIEIVKDIIVQSKTPTRILSGKTGSDYDGKNVIRGWFVGHIKSNGRDHVFVTNIKGKNNAWGRTAQKITYKILEKMKL